MVELDSDDNLLKLMELIFNSDAVFVLHSCFPEHFCAFG